jgi:hypothetical protein
VAAPGVVVDDERPGRRRIDDLAQPAPRVVGVDADERASGEQRPQLGRDQPRAPPGEHDDRLVGGQAGGHQLGGQAAGPGLEVSIRQLLAAAGHGRRCRLPAGPLLEHPVELLIPHARSLQFVLGGLNVNIKAS